MSSFRKPKTIRRKSGGFVNDDGYFEPGKFEEIIIKASVQPLNHSEKEQYTAMKPQGGRQGNLVKVYTNSELFPTRQATNSTVEREGDVLLWQGKTWRCIDCDAFQSGVISHYRGIFQEIDEDISEAVNNDNGAA